MSLLEFPIRRYPFTLIVFLCLAVLGWFAFSNIPREEDPVLQDLRRSSSPRSSRAPIRRTSSASSPSPSKDRLAELDDVKKIETTVVGRRRRRSASSSKPTRMPTRRYDEVTREVNALRPELPQDIAQLEIRKCSPGLVNIVELALVSEDAPYRELEDYARELKDTLKSRRRHPHLRELGIPRARAARRSRPEAHGGARCSRRARSSKPCRARTRTSPRDSRPRPAQLQPQDLGLVHIARRSARHGGLGRGRPFRSRARHRECELGHAALELLARFNGKRAVIVTANQKRRLQHPDAQ